MSEWIEVGWLEDIPRLGARVVRRPGRDIAVFRNAADEVFALEDRCPHKGGPLSQGIVHGCRVTCPLHNMVIELETGSAVAPDEGIVTKVPVKIENGRIFLQVETAVESTIAAGEGNRERNPADGKQGRTLSETQRTGRGHERPDQDDVPLLRHRVRRDRCARRWWRMEDFGRSEAPGQFRQAVR